MPLKALRHMLLAFALALPASTAETPTAPYAGQQVRSLKALSDEDAAALRNGDGMGMAKAAELNGYPGPRHVLTLASRLHLTEDQRQQVTAIYERMSADAKPLGQELLDHEATLDRLFADGTITPDRLTVETAAIGELQGRLRAVHLTAHLGTRAVLSRDQVARYGRLRGYGDPATPMQHHHQHG
jgi:Spy/CpxP family protein refolding chaperone